MKLADFPKKQLFSAAGNRQGGPTGQNHPSTVFLFKPEEVMQIHQVLVVDPVKICRKQPAFQMFKCATKHGFAAITKMGPGIIAVRLYPNHLPSLHQRKAILAGQDNPLNRPN
jgi:hypothetical protein